MKTVSDHYSARFSIDGNALNGAFDESLLGRIGDDLRHLYSEVVQSDTPQPLMELAQAIDALRAGETRND